MSRPQACRVCLIEHEYDDLAGFPDVGTCWPSWMAHVNETQGGAEAWAGLQPAGWYQICERCSSRQWVTRDRPLCPACLRVHGRWRLALTTCPCCKRPYGRGRRTAASCCGGTTVRARAVSAARERGTHTEAEWQAKVLEHHGQCAYCGVDGGLTRDHVVPVSRGGSDAIGNIVPACRSCNSSKGARTFKEWLLIQQSVESAPNAPC